MGISILILLLVAFVVFMFTSEGVSDPAKRVVLAIAIVGVGYILFKIIKG